MNKATIALAVMAVIILILGFVLFIRWLDDKTQAEIKFENEKLNNATIDGFYQGVVAETAYLIKSPVSLNLNSTERPIYAACSCISEDNFKKIYGQVPERINVDNFVVKLLKGE